MNRLLNKNIVELKYMYICVSELEILKRQYVHGIPQFKKNQLIESIKTTSMEDVSARVLE